ncbi:MAG: TRAP transporter substrate-binding protein [Rubrivivax sp.]|nr:TRAP transporter substrate-binding protein [Rubrivivax sp.]
MQPAAARPTFARLASQAGIFLLCVLSSMAARPQAPGEAVALRIVGGLAGVNQFTRHEEPFWTRDLPRLTGGRVTAQVVPFDRAGLRGQEMLSLMRSGAVPFGTALLALGSPRDLELNAPDLAGLNPDMPTLRRNVALFRPTLEALLRERGIEPLALYTYPAQVLFCRRAISGLASLKGLRVRTSSPSQSDWVEALGGQAVTTPFADILHHLRAGNIDCAITGTMSGNTIGLHELTTHLYTQPVTWGLSMFGANAAAWRALPEDLRTLLRRELARLETEIWAESERETGSGIECNTGAPTCRGGQPGRMTLVPPVAADDQRRREIFASLVLPRWLQRCGPGCAPLWNRTLGAGNGVRAPER